MEFSQVRFMSRRKSWMLAQETYSFDWLVNSLERLYVMFSRAKPWDARHLLKSVTFSKSYSVSDCGTRWHSKIWTP